MITEAKDRVVSHEQNGYKAISALEIELSVDTAAPIGMVLSAIEPEFSYKTQGSLQENVRRTGQTRTIVGTDVTARHLWPENRNKLKDPSKIAVIGVGGNLTIMNRGLTNGVKPK